MVLGWESGWRIWSVSLGGGTKVNSPWSASDCTGDVTVTKTRQTTCNAWVLHWGTVRCFQGLNAIRLSAKYGSDPQTWALGLVKWWLQVLKYQLRTNLLREARPMHGRQHIKCLFNVPGRVNNDQANPKKNWIQKDKFHWTAKRRNNLWTTGG